MNINFSKQAFKFLKAQDAINRKRILTAISTLPKGDVKKLVGTTQYRLRVGDYRILFSKDGNIINISKIGNRGEIYK